MLLQITRLMPWLDVAQLDLPNLGGILLFPPRPIGLDDLP